MPAPLRPLLNGLDVLLDENPSRIKGCKIGLVTHPAAVTAGLQDAIRAVRAAGLDLAALFGPEHGLYGLAADGVKVDSTRDRRTGLPVFSLYGDTHEPTPAMLAGVDLLLFDMQDVGVRFYTYASTLFYVLRGATRAGKPVIVLDRPNPLGGAVVEGPPLEPGFESFVGIAPLALRHGLTFGELAGWFNARLEAPAELSVIRMKNWRRERWFDQCGRPWVPTSPAMPHFSTALVYPGACLLEGTNLSEGRGTALPFELAGAPWVDGPCLAERLNQERLPGVIFRPAAFTPWSSKHAGQACEGVQWHVTDRAAFRPVRAGLHLLAACRDLFPADFQVLPSSWEGSRPAHLDLLAGSAALREGLTRGVNAEELCAGWPALEARFSAETRPFWLYP